MCERYCRWHAGNHAWLCARALKVIISAWIWWRQKLRSEKSSMNTTSMKYSLEICMRAWLHKCSLLLMLSPLRFTSMFYVATIIERNIYTVKMHQSVWSCVGMCMYHATQPKNFMCIIQKHAVPNSNESAALNIKNKNPPVLLVLCLDSRLPRTQLLRSPLTSLPVWEKRTARGTWNRAVRKIHICGSARARHVLSGTRRCDCLARAALSTLTWCWSSNREQLGWIKIRKNCVHNYNTLNMFECRN